MEPWSLGLSFSLPSQRNSFPGCLLSKWQRDAMVSWNRMERTEEAAVEVDLDGQLVGSRITQKTSR